MSSHCTRRGPPSANQQAELLSDYCLTKPDSQLRNQGAHIPDYDWLALLSTRSVSFTALISNRRQFVSQLCSLGFLYHLDPHHSFHCIEVTVATGRPAEKRLFLRVSWWYKDISKSSWKMGVMVGLLAGTNSTCTATLNHLAGELPLDGNPSGKAQKLFRHTVLRWCPLS